MSVEVKSGDDDPAVPNLDLFGSLLVECKDSSGQFIVQLRSRKLTIGEEILVISASKEDRCWISEFDCERLTKTGLFGMGMEDYRRVLERLIHNESENIEVFPLNLPMGVDSHTLGKFELMKLKKPLSADDECAAKVRCWHCPLLICLKDLLLTGITSDPISKVIEYRLILDSYSPRMNESVKIRVDFQRQISHLRSEWMSQLKDARMEIERLKEQMGSLMNNSDKKSIMDSTSMVSLSSCMDDKSVVSDDLPFQISCLDSGMFTLDMSSHHPCSDNTLESLNSKDVRCGAGTNSQRDPWIAIRFAWAMKVKSISLAPMAYIAPGSWGPKYLDRARLMVLLPRDTREIELKMIYCSDLRIKKFTINREIREVIIRKLDITDFLGIGHLSIETD